MVAGVTLGVVPPTETGSGTMMFHLKGWMDNGKHWIGEAGGPVVLRPSRQLKPIFSKRTFYDIVRFDSTRVYVSPL